MRIGQRLLGRAATAKIGALAAVMLLVLAVPGIAFAANTATFSSATPKGGSFTKASKPTVSVIVYDKYGVKTGYALYIDGVKQSSVKISRYSGFGYKKFKLSKVPAALGNGSHTVKVTIKDLKSKVSTYSWKFSVDTVAPVTVTSGSLPQFIAPGSSSVSGFVFLTTTDAGSGVAQTYFSIDGAAPVAGSLVVYNFTAGAHTVEFWSVDKAGNVEAHTVLSTSVANGHSLPTKSVDAACLGSGCHGGASDVLAIHAAVPPTGCPCHSSQTLTNDCVACHTSSPNKHTAASHPTVDSSATVGSATSCTNATLGCHTDTLFAIHKNACGVCHNPAADSAIPSATVNAVVAAGIAGTPAKCESCHGAYAAIHAAGDAAHTKSGACFTTFCHGTDVTRMHTKDFRGTGANTVPGCVACHGAGKTPTTNCTACHPDLVTPHDATARHAALGVTSGIVANSVACVSCHGSDLTQVALVSPKSSGVPTSPTGVDEHKGCSCHSYLEAGNHGSILPAGQFGCQNCHGTKDFGVHGFGKSNIIGGHSTTMFGKAGAYTKFDGSQGIVVKSSTGATITQDWLLPTADVFWSQSSMVGTDSPLVAMDKRGFSSAAVGAAAVNKTVGWNSVITCQDCHTQLTGALGPQGANVPNFGLDPNFPDDWTQAELTSWDPTGMRSTTTTSTDSNPYYTKIWDSTVIGGTTTSTATGSGYSWGDVTGRYICQKCHKLTNWKQGYPVQSRSGRSQQGMGVSNTAHMEHHPDQIRGQANCVSCHVAIPHGWTRPRLLVYSTDSAPYKAPQPSNWFYGTNGSQYLDGIYAGDFTASLETSPVVPGYGRELVDGGTLTGWDNSVKGVEWIAPGTETGENEGQPNCNACSAAGGTHTPASEGVPAGLPLWK